MNFAQIHLFHIGLPDHFDRLVEYSHYLDEAESMRANRFLSARDRQAFVVAHGVLRQVLGNCLNQSPKDLQFEYGRYGKPFIKQTPIPLQFNLSHSCDCAVIAMTQDCAIGVDVECIKRCKARDAIARRFFSGQEFECYKQCVDEDQKLELFYQIWTGKEAFVKAKGEGIFRHSLHGFTVDSLKALIHVPNGQNAAKGKWHCLNHSPFPQYISSVCWFGEEKQIVIHNVT